jgi:hypothetical protein
MPTRLPNAGHKNPKTLSGIETADTLQLYPSPPGTKTLKPYQGLKQDLITAINNFPQGAQKP